MEYIFLQKKKNKKKAKKKKTPGWPQYRPPATPETEVFFRVA